jgi:hypothetical protein
MGVMSVSLKRKNTASSSRPLEQASGDRPLVGRIRSQRIRAASDGSIGGATLAWVQIVSAVNRVAKPQQLPARRGWPTLYYKVRPRIEADVRSGDERQKRRIEVAKLIVARYLRLDLSDAFRFSSGVIQTRIGHPAAPDHIGLDDCQTRAGRSNPS